MKKFQLTWMAILIFVLGSCSYDDGSLWNKVNEIDGRLTTVEAQLSAMNSSVNSMQTILNALQQNVYVTNWQEISSGYVLTLSNNKQITITNGVDGLTPYIGSNGNWWIGQTDTGVLAEGKNGADGQTPYVGENGNWWVGQTDTGVAAEGKNGADGQTPYVGENGNWWIGQTDTGVRAEGRDGKDGITPHVGDNGNWWFGSTDTGYAAIGHDGISPVIGTNGNWWLGGVDTGVCAVAQNGTTPHIGENGNWWIGTTDTGINVVSGDGSNANVPIIGIDTKDGVYYWTVTVNGTTTWLVDKSNNMMPVSGYAPIFQVDPYGYLIYSIDNGVSWLYIYDSEGYVVKQGSGSDCSCTQFFKAVYVSGQYLYLVLLDGTEIKILISGGGRGDIPDDPTDPTPTLPGTPNIVIPYPNLIPNVDEWGNHVVQVDFTGIQDPNTKEWINLYGTGLSTQNIWLEVDNTPKGIIVVNLEDNTTRVKNDIIFTVDNSGSMGQEADAIANGIVNWANMLDAKGLDVQFGVVGFGGNVGSQYSYLIKGYGVTGAMDISSVNNLNSFLSHSTGVNRTKGFYGSNANTLQTEANKDKWYYAGGENGAQAVRFANDIFSFRATANRIYINFTDDCNFTGGNSDISVEYFKDRSKWSVSNGTIHSVISNDKSTLTSRANAYPTWEYPWLLSEYTNGTIMFVNSDASNLKLDQLTVSDAITHSYTLKFIIPESLLDGQPHTIRIVVIANDGTVRGVLEFTAIFGNV